MQVLGSGAFGEVSLCIHRATGSQRAVKILRKEDMEEGQEADIRNEIANLKNLHHPNIIKIYEFYEDSEAYYIITDICSGGELFNEILTRGRFSEADAAVLMKQILSCVNYCHKNNVVHRDLKPENILMESNRQFDQIKIIDFGAATVFRER